MAAQVSLPKRTIEKGITSKSRCATRPQLAAASAFIFPTLPATVSRGGERHAGGVARPRLRGRGAISSWANIPTALANVPIALAKVPIALASVPIALVNVRIAVASIPTALANVPIALASIPTALTSIPTAAQTLAAWRATLARRALFLNPRITRLHLLSYHYSKERR